MAKPRRKDGQRVLLLDVPPATNSALQNNMNTPSAKKEAASAESLARLEKLIPISPEVGSPLNVALIYEDVQTRDWAREIYERVARLAAEQGVRPTWWNLNHLSEPGVLAAAVSTAMRADVVIIAACAGEGMPLAFYTWINAWLPNRYCGGGVLAAILGKTERSNAKPARVGEYLREVARQGRMHFLLETRKLQMAPNGVNGHLHSKSAPTANRTLVSMRF